VRYILEIIPIFNTYLSLHKIYNAHLGALNKHCNTEGQNIQQNLYFSYTLNIQTVHTSGKGLV